MGFHIGYIQILGAIVYKRLKCSWSLLSTGVLEQTFQNLQIFRPKEDCNSQSQDTSTQVVVTIKR
jgi:hypothetical protein